MKKTLRFLSLLVFLTVLTGCFAAAASAEAIEITIPHYKTGENVGAKFFLPQVERFNTLYEGKYHVVIEELTQDLYVEKIKQLGLQGKLPPVIEGGDTEWIREVVIPNNMFYDLSGVLAGHPEIDAITTEWNRAYNTTADGKFVTLNFNVVRPMTLYYNEAMLPLAKAPGEYADWAELLAQMGGNKIAFMTGENAWTTMLTFSSLVAAEEGGVQLLSEHQIEKLTDFSHPALLAATEKLQAMLQKYASSNTVGAVYADAANAFMSKNAAIIANGSWMVGDFAPDARDKWSNGFDGATVRGAVFPGNIAVSGTSGSFGWWIPATATDDQKECASAFLAFILSAEELEAYMLAEGGTAPLLAPSEAFLSRRAAENPLLDEYVGAVNAQTVLIPAFADCIPSSVANTGFGTLLPKLIDGTLTPAQFLEQLGVMAKEAMDV